MPMLCMSDDGEMPMLLFLSDDGEMQPGGMGLNEASLHVSEEDAEAFHQFLDEARLHVSERDADAFHQSRSLYVSYDTCHGTRGGGDEMSTDQDEATVRDDDVFIDSVMATGTCHGIRGGGGQMTKH